MSSWPLISDFSRMLQNPQVAFRAPELKQCSVELNQLGQPKARSGNFATVYRGYRPDSSEFAIRIFNRRQDDRLEHYRTISAYLEHRAISSIVHFDYDERGIRSASDGKLYPLLIMEWVPGITLFEWIRDRCREGYAEALQIAAEVWLHLVRELAQHHLVHGDLQHGNVMVSPDGHFRLVDYDCMCVPALIGRRNLEIGMLPYQHPARNVDTLLYPGLDNFSALVIYVALRALAAAPQLWTAYVEQPEYDKILFRPQDFENPSASRLYHDLLRSPDEQVRDLAHYLFELVKYNLHDIPPVDEVLLWCQSVERLITAHEWDSVVQLVERMHPGEQLDPQLQPYVDEARRRVACRQATEEALAEGNEERVEQLFATGLLQDYPAAAHLLEPARQAAAVRPVLRVLASAKQFQAWDKLKSTWLAHQQLLAGRASAKPFEWDVQKLLTLDRVRELLAAPQVDDRALQEAWDYLQKLGGHPTAEPYREHVQQRLARRDVLLKLQELLLQAPKVPTLAYDKKILGAAPPELIATLDPASPLVKQYETVSRRLQAVRKVHELEKAGTVEAETFIANVMQELPNTYHEGLARRSQQARKRLYLFREFVQALQEPCSETRIVRTWGRLGEIRGRALATPEMQARVQLAEARAPLIRALRTIPEKADDAERRRRVLEIWDDTLLRDCPQAAPWRALFEQSRSIQESVQRIAQAVEAGHLADVERLLADPALQGADLPPRQAQILEAARGQIHQAALARRQALVNVLRENRRLDFAAVFDAALLADICRQSRHHQPVVSQWVEAEILPLPRSGLAADPETALKRDEDGTLTILWTWPPPTVSNTCRLVITKERVAPHAQPDDVPALYAAAIARQDWNPALGLRLAWDAAWEGASVYVWAVVDVGFQVFYSQPLEVGQFKAAAKQRRWGLFRSWRSEKKAAAAEESAPETPAEQAGEPVPSDAPEAAPPTPEAAAGEQPREGPSQQ